MAPLVVKTGFNTRRQELPKAAGKQSDLLKFKNRYPKAQPGSKVHTRSSSPSSSPHPGEKRRSKWIGQLVHKQKVVRDIDGQRQPCEQTTWMAIQDGDIVYRLGDAVYYTTPRPNGSVSLPAKGVIRRLEQIHPARGNLRIYVHIHRLRKSIVGHENELFLDDCQCLDIRLADLRGKFNCVHADQQEPTPDVSFYRYVYEASHSGWREPDPLAECDACVAQKRRETETRLVLLPDGIRFLDTVFHQGDCVYVDTQVIGKAWKVAQIVGLPSVVREFGKVKSNFVSVRLFARFSEMAKASKYRGFISDKRLVMTDKIESVPFSLITGKAHVVTTEDEAKIIKLGFFCRERASAETNPVDTIEPYTFTISCKTCLTAALNKGSDRREVLANQKMPAIDLYCGGGGSILGARGIWDLRAVVDRDPSKSEQACHETVRQNKTHNPHMKIYRKTVEEFLVEAKNGMRPGPRGALDIPSPGYIFCLTACPPCQGHSHANIQRKREDHRNDELFNAIRAVEHFRPDVFMLENVPGMKYERLDSGDDMDTKETKNFAREAVRRLLGLNYQCRVALLDSRAYGSPQNRLRLFIIAAKRGVTMPHFPAPTHSNPRVQVSVFTVESDDEHPGFYVGLGTPGSGPMMALTAEEAISDFPGDPRHLPRHGRATFPCISGLPVGFNRPVPYATVAANTYQLSKRGSPGSDTVTDHYTRSHGPMALDQIYEARQFTGRGLGDESGTKRMTDPSGGFFALMTDSGVGRRYTGPIHWNQKRTFTIAERKRIQGVPDDYKLQGNVKEQDTMLGNMVNVDIAHAIYSQIVDEVVLPWWISHGKPSRVFEVWRQQHPAI